MYGVRLARVKIWVWGYRRLSSGLQEGLGWVRLCRVTLTDLDWEV